MMTRSTLALACLAACTAVLPARASAKTFTDYFKPTPIACTPTTNTWGDKAVLPRDTCNGLEDTSGTPTVKPKWMYWDGRILRAADGKYHMFADRWPHANGMGDWVNSDTVHAISSALLGPYVDQGYAFNDGPDSKDPHKGHNVTASELPDGTYCLIVDEIVPFTVFTAASLDVARRGEARPGKIRDVDGRLSPPAAGLVSRVGGCRPGVRGCQAILHARHDASGNRRLSHTAIVAVEERE